MASLSRSALKPYTAPVSEETPTASSSDPVLPPEHVAPVKKGLSRSALKPVSPSGERPKKLNYEDKFQDPPAVPMGVDGGAKPQPGQWKDDPVASGLATTVNDLLAKGYNEKAV